ncbi:glycosyltransferase [Empedobacter falsenii]
MSKVILQISSEVNIGSVGKIAEQIGEHIIEEGWKSIISYGREISTTKSDVFRIGSDLDVWQHVLFTRLTGKHGFYSKSVTKKLIKKIIEINPDVIHLHHLHGYFINIKILFEFLQTLKKPVIWTFHDCWSFTGHCAYYETVNCEKWKTGCYACPQINDYPKSWLIDNSKFNYKEKKYLFNLVDNLTIVPVSDWIGQQVNQSFLKDINISVIKNGIDISIFKHRESNLRENLSLLEFKIILGVAYVWDERKGLQDFLNLSKIIDSNFRIILIGLTDDQIKKLPENIIGIKKVKDQELLAEYYSIADVFVNPTKDEALGLTNIEALACGTPIVTYNSGGAVESVFEGLGFIVEKNNIEQIKEKIEILTQKSKDYFIKESREKVESYFDKRKQFKQYIDLYKKLLE